eukprot:CAMPEP_0181234846 /NCGR_PEP_ID=MMETSP1096-20121128/37213_1 /TAXON_ID=156174 ORGANISM="Chrysochromulina ericina, Strain CCMP281" /NCGR_SAMPLE_ID=MMETSP1096 /ASSEMBLY_ACC=CAM_ASM_000453 /LENGTH=271 /DNA_ID=CAMNT_0023329693 /DNA_START=295 /DNA_END=1110 /DNA_ORIENTATION=+
MAEHKQEPSIPKARKNGWEAVDRYFWGYIDTARFTKAAVPDADSWKGSKSFHEYSGRCADRQRAESVGPLQVRLLSCPDNECLLGHFGSCKHKVEVGIMRHVETPLAKGSSRLREGLMMQLHEFAEQLEKDMVVAVNAADDERFLEGSYWLALLLGGAFQCPEQMVHATDVFEAGWLVVRVRWYELKQVSQRGYILSYEERLVPVNAIVRLLGLAFSNSYSVGRETRSATVAGSSLHFLDEDSHNLIEAACRHAPNDVVAETALEEEPGGS